MQGHLHLTASLNAVGRTYVREQSFKAPLHLSKPHEDAGALIVNIVNPTAGLFDGDEIDIRASVEKGAHLVLTTPSANRVYRARGEGAAVVTQSYRVASGAFLEFYPELLIPQAGARYHQRTEIRVEAGGSLLFFEWLAPGRVASGEVFQFDELVWDTDVWFAEQLVARERYTINPASESMEALTQVFPESHYLGCFLIGELPFSAAAVEALQCDDIYLGHSALTAGGWTIKSLCRDGMSTRSLMKDLRTAIYQQFERMAPSLGRF
jgi:urease accessory protein